MTSIKNNILDEITQLSNANISNFMINSIKFGEIINKMSKTSENEKKHRAHKRNKTIFKFDFTTTNITLLKKEIINNNEFNNNSAKEKFLKIRKTKSQDFNQLNSLVEKLLNNDENKNNENNILDLTNKNSDNNNNEGKNDENEPRKNKLLAKTLVPEIKKKNTVNLSLLNSNLNFQENEKKIEYLNNNNYIEEKDEEGNSMIIHEDDNDINNNKNNNLNLFSLTNQINSTINKVKNENEKDIINNEEEINVKFKANNKIDIIEKNQREFYKGNITKNINKKINDENQKKENNEQNENIFTYDLIKISKIENLTNISTQENVSAMTMDVDNLVYCGTSKGLVIIYNLNDGTVKKIFNNTFENLILSSINSICVINDYFACGFSNGYIKLYSKKGNTIKLFKEIKNITNESIIDIALYSGKNKVGIYSSDIKGNIYKTKIKFGWFKDSIYNTLIFNNKNLNNNNNEENGINSNNNSENIINAFYLIDIHSINHKIIGIANKIGFYLYYLTKNNKNKIFEFLIPKNNYYLPSFFFGKDLNANKIFLSMDNIINIYNLEILSQKVTLESVFNFNIPIAKIGTFIHDVIYVFDKSQNITIINYKFQKSLNFNFEKGNNSINISNKNVDLFVNKVIYNHETKNFYPTYNNSLCSTNTGTILINGTKKIQFIEYINPKDCIMKIYREPNHLKWENLFNLFIQIYQDKHPLYKLSDISNFKNLFFDTSKQFLNLLLPNLLVLEGQNKEIVQKEIEYFIYFLFEIELIDFITYENGMYKIFLDFNLQKYFYELLEPYIMNDKLKMDGIPDSFIINMINEYVNYNKKELLCQLLIHFKLNLLSNTNLYEKIIENNLFNFEFFFLNEKIKIAQNNNNNLINIDLFKPINLMRNYIAGKEVEENDDLIDINIDIYDDKIVYSNNYIKLKILWFINDILEREFINNKDIYKNFINNSKEFLNSAQGLDLFNKSFSNEYIYTIEKLKKKIDDDIVVNKDNLDFHNN